MDQEGERWTIFHFSLANAVGPEQGDVPALLRRVADEVEGRGDIEVQDIVFHAEEYGTRPSMTVYFSDAEDEAPGADAG